MPTEAQVAALLRSYAAAEFPGDATAQNAMIAVFDDATARQRIPSPSLRAALAALVGTLAEPAVADVLAGRLPDGAPRVVEVAFASPDEMAHPEEGVAETQLLGTGQQRILVSDLARADSPFLFARVLAHQLLHQDSEVSNYEESVSRALDGLVYLHQLGRHPGLAALRTPLSRIDNSNALARLNSGQGTRLGLYRSNRAAHIFPGALFMHQNSWWEFLDDGDTRVTPGNALLGQYLARAHEAGAPLCSPAEFGKVLLDCIDENGNDGLSPEELVAAARALKLSLGPDVAAGLAPALGSALPPLRRGGIRGLLAAGGFTVKGVSAPGPGTVRVILRGRIVVASGANRFATAARGSVPVRLTSAGRRLLRRSSRLRLTLLVTFVDRDGARTSVSLAVMLRR